jgi:serine O-acetyltransferase
MANKKIGYFASIKQRDKAAKSWLHILLFYPGVHAMIGYRLARLLYVLRIPLLPFLISGLTRLLTGVDIHPGARIGKRLFIDHGMGVVIGEMTVIGHDVTLYHGVTLGSKGPLAGKRHPTIEHGVLIGVNASILGGVTVGENAVISAHSLVLKDVPANTKVPAGSVYK